MISPKALRARPGRIHFSRKLLARPESAERVRRSAKRAPAPLHWLDSRFPLRAGGERARDEGRSHVLSPHPEPCLDALPLHSGEKISNQVRDSASCRRLYTCRPGESSPPFSGDPGSAWQDGCVRSPTTTGEPDGGRTRQGLPAPLLPQAHGRVAHPALRAGVLARAPRLLTAPQGQRAGPLPAAAAPREGPALAPAPGR